MAGLIAGRRQHTYPETGIESALLWTYVNDGCVVFIYILCCASWEAGPMASLPWNHAKLPSQQP